MGNDKNQNEEEGEEKKLPMTGLLIDRPQTGNGDNSLQKSWNSLEEMDAFTTEEIPGWDESGNGEFPNPEIKPEDPEEPLPGELLS
jgi:hypothetical protein